MVDANSVTFKLPNGVVIKDIPASATRAEIKQKAIQKGWAKEADFGEPSGGLNEPIAALMVKDAPAETTKPPLKDAEIAIDDVIKTNVPDIENKDLSVLEYLGGRVGNIIDSFKEDSAKRGESLSQTFSSFKEGEIPLKIMGQQALGTTAGMAFDTVGSIFIEGLGTNFDTMKLFIPDDVEDAVKAKAVEGIKYIMNTEGGQAGIEALGKGQEAYSAFKEKYPIHAKNLESFLNVALIGSPSTKILTGAKTPKAIKNQVTATRDNIVTLGRDLEASAIKQTKAATKIPKDREALRYYQSYKDLTDKNHLKRVSGESFKVNILEAEQIAALKKVPGFKPSANPLKNLEKVNAEKAKQLKKITNATQNSNVVVEKSRVLSRVDEALKKLVDEDPLGNQKDMIAAVNDIRARAVAALKVMDDAPTPSNLYKARLEFDDIIKDVKTDQIFTQRGAGARAVKRARDTMNEALNDAVPGIKEELKSAHNLLTVADDLIVKVQKKHDGHLMGVITDMIKANSSARDIGFIIAGMGIGGGYAMSAPYIFAGGAGTIGAIVTSKAFWKYGVKGSKGQKAIAAIKKGTGKAIREIPNMSEKSISVLKADRAAVIESIEDAMDRWENGGEEAFKADQPENTPES